jgi:hypothetical protein
LVIQWRDCEAFRHSRTFAKFAWLIDGRKGIFIEYELYTQLSFFKSAGERFARNREEGLRYGEIMKEYPNPGCTLQDEGQATKFMPFAGTEGYNPVAYAPYVLALAIGNALGLDFPNVLHLPRRVLATMAITGSLLAGMASVQALLGAHWSVP